MEAIGGFLEFVGEGLQGAGQAAAPAKAVATTGAGVKTGVAALRAAGAAVRAEKAAAQVLGKTTTLDGLANPVPETLARAVPEIYGPNPPALGPLSRGDVFVTDAEALRGLNAKQISEALAIPEAEAFNVFEFSSRGLDIASPYNRPDANFVNGGRTKAGLPEFVIPNGPFPEDTTRRTVR
ncbi:polymorphic toxin type 10 domain-containing protein [Chelatococcus asaccharovorans]|uniref:polymorphic toxin type 10 domain-containing protein n=1 Tax=Chelatococcus asaccharovorans TaxID=28210 RepID=UPI003CCEF4E1